MIKQVFKTMVAVLAIAAAAAGPVRGQNASPDVTLDFTTNDWGLPTSGYNNGPNSYSNGTYTITVYAYTNYKFNSNYLILGRDGSYLELPEFSSPVEKIEVVGNSAASGSVKQNIYVGGTAVSTQTTGAKKPNTYVINENYRAAGNIYTLKVESTHNTQITYIKVYYVSSGGGSTPEPEPAPAVPHTVRMAAGTEDAANWSIASGDALVTGNQVLENVMSGSEVTATYNGTRKVKSVKAVKYVAPAATVTTAPTATEAIIEAGSTTALVNGGTAEGGTMMYAVTTTNARPTDGFSATRPTAEGRAAGTYYVWYYAKADAEHSDSEIAGPVSVTVAVMTTVTWNSTNVFKSDNRQDRILNNEWDSNPLTYEGVTISMSAFSEESVSSFKAYNEHDQAGGLTCFGEDGDSFTFTAPDGKKFCKIEIIDEWGITFDEYGDWTEGENNNIVWSGTAASTVTLGTVHASANHLTSIVFKLIDAQ